MTGFPRPPADDEEREACENFDSIWCHIEGDDAYCTRRPGHGGDHIGCDDGVNVIARWRCNCHHCNAPALPAPSVDEALRRFRIDLTDTSGKRRLIECDEDVVRAFLEAIGPEGRAAGMAGLEVGGEHGAA